jgi:hypothetical protein
MTKLIEIVKAMMLKLTTVAFRGLCSKPWGFKKSAPSLESN